MLEEKLLDAVKAKDYESVKKLIAEGADVNYLRDTGMSPLLYAESEDDVEMARILLDNGADINFRYPPRMQNLLQMAAMENRKEMIELFLRYKPDINNRDAFGNNALASACHGGDMEIIELLLQHGADPYTLNKVGEILVGKKKQPMGESTSPYSVAVEDNDTALLALFEKYKQS